MKTKGKRAGRILSLLLALCMMFAMSISALADDTTLTAAEDPTESIMTLSMGIEYDDGTYIPISYGTCFLVNDEYALTNNHVVAVDSEWLEYAEAATGVSFSPLDDHIKRKIHLSRDITVGVTVDEDVKSEVMDFALVKIDRKIYEKKPLKLGDSDAVNVKDKVYAYGFPGDSITTRDNFEKDGVSVVPGEISKITNTDAEDLFEHTAPLNHGNSGGPLMTEDDVVIGVNSSGTETKNYAARINRIKSAMDTFGIPYIDAGTSEVINNDNDDDNEDVIEEPVVDNSAILSKLQNVIEEAKDIDTEGYTEETVDALNDSIGTAETVVQKGTDATEAEILNATDDLNQAIENLEEKSGPNMILIGGIAAAVVIVIIIIIVIVMSNKKKKAAAATSAPAGPAGYMPPSGTGTAAPVAQAPVQPQPMAQPQQAPEGAGETTLLDAGAGETTLLGGGAGTAYLIRKKNGEKIAINLQNFKIGKERSKVNYCVSDNTSVSRIHCEIVKKGADYYVVDNGSTNFTFVNGVQLSPRQETLLSDQSVVKLSDEEFEFHLS